MRWSDDYFDLENVFYLLFAHEKKKLTRFVHEESYSIKSREYGEYLLLLFSNASSCTIFPVSKPYWLWKGIKWAISNKDLNLYSLHYRTVRELVRAWLRGTAGYFQEVSLLHPSEFWEIEAMASTCKWRHCKRTWFLFREVFCGWKEYDGTIRLLQCLRSTECCRGRNTPWQCLSHPDSSFFANFFCCLKFWVSTATLFTSGGFSFLFFFLIYEKCNGKSTKNDW